jgi:hypothetical protein
MYSRSSVSVWGVLISVWETPQTKAAASEGRFELGSLRLLTEARDGNLQYTEVAILEADTYSHLDETYLMSLRKRIDMLRVICPVVVSFSKESFNRLKVWCLLPTIQTDGMQG